MAWHLHLWSYHEENKTNSHTPPEDVQMHG